MKKNLIAVILLLAGYLTCYSTFGYEFNFLTESPVAYFTDLDWKLYKSTAKNALDTAKDGSKVEWKNPKSGSSGYFIPSGTTVKNGLKCRSLYIFNSAHHRTDASTYEVCKYNTGWKIPGDA